MYSIYWAGLRNANDAFSILRESFMMKKIIRNQNRPVKIWTTTYFTDSWQQSNIEKYNILNVFQTFFLFWEEHIRITLVWNFTIHIAKQENDVHSSKKLKGKNQQWQVILYYSNKYGKNKHFLFLQT